MITKPEFKKRDAKELLEARGITIQPANNFASWNTAGGYFWADVRITHVKNNWTLICNDQNERVLYVFQIPANSLPEAGFYHIPLKPAYLQIKLTKDTFTDTVGAMNYSFKPYLTDVVKY